MNSVRQISSQAQLLRRLEVPKNLPNSNIMKPFASVSVAE